MEGIGQQFFELLQDIKNSIRQSLKNWLCEAGRHQGKTLTAPHDHKPDTTIHYCSHCGGIIDEFEDEEGVSWTSEAH